MATPNWFIVVMFVYVFVSLGVDFQVKPMLVGDSIIILQLWDTAGQERCVCHCVHCMCACNVCVVGFFLFERVWVHQVEQGERFVYSPCCVVDILMV